MFQLNGHQRRLLFMVVMVLLIGIGFKVVDRHRKAIDFNLKGLLDGYKYSTAINLTPNEVRATTPALQPDSEKPINPQTAQPKTVIPQTDSKPSKTAKVSKTSKALPITLIEINKADSLELLKLPGIGPVLAGRIIACRDSIGKFNNAGDLLKVKGIGDKKLAKIKPYLKY
jgi:competence ComEA-like helix-hairpin-helix protein